MSDPADKSDDLIAELAKLMAQSTGGSTSAVQPVQKAAPLDPAYTIPTPPSAAPSPVRIPGMDVPAPRPVMPSAAPDARGPATGSIRIPGMDQPAPVSTSAPVSKFDFGKPVASPDIRQEPLSTLSERLAAQAPQPVPRMEPVPVSAAPRIPSNLTPVSENCSFAQSPALSVAPPAAAPAMPASESGDFHFDFGFAQNPPASAPVAPSAPPEADPIADLIAADMAEAETIGSPVEEEAYRPPVVAPAIRNVVTAQVPPRATMTPMASAAPRSAGNAPIPLKPVSVAPRAPSNDRFAISPGVGLNVKPPASQPLGVPQPPKAPPRGTIEESDPMSEIESLIGEAVRVELSPAPTREQATVFPTVALEPEVEIEREIHHGSEPAPVVPPLTTQFAPRRANLREDLGASSADDAIRAAAAASGAEVNMVEPSLGDDSPYRRLKVKPARSSFLSGGLRQYVGMAVAGTLLLAAGLGLYWVLNMGRTANTGAAAPQLTADVTPVKVKPTATVQPVTDQAKSPVLAKMDGVSQAPSSELLMPTEQPTAEVTRDVLPDTQETESGLANRKVRTVTVRPDGTIVSGDDAVAGATELPIDRPNVPSVPSTENTNLLGDTSPLLTPTDTPTALVPSEPVTDVATIKPVIDSTIVAPVPMSFPVRTAAVKPAAANPTVNAVVGAQTPNGQIDLLADNSALAPQPTVAVSDGGGAAAYVQLSSMPSEAEATAQVKTATARYGDLFGGSKLLVQQADLGQKGIRYRVRLPVNSLADATSICAQIKAAGGDCFATNG